MRLHNFFDLTEATRNDVNFDANDLKRLEDINDLGELKRQAFALINNPSERPMKPAKVSWFRQALAGKTNKIAVLKMMYDLMLSGEGNSVIGTATSTVPNSYRAKFGEGEGDAAVGYGPYDRGVADGYYGRQPRPHKYVTNAEGKRIPVKLTDPKEIAAYMSGFKDDSFGSKDYSESIEEHIVKVKGGYELKSKHGDKNLGKYPTRAGAEKRERQVQYFKHAGK